MSRLVKGMLLLGAMPLALVVSSAVRGYEDIPPPKASPNRVAPAPVPPPKAYPPTRAPAAPLTPPPKDVTAPPAGNVVIPPAGNLPPNVNVVVPPVEPRGEQLEGFQRIGKQLFDSFVNPGGAAGPVQQKPLVPGELNTGIQQIFERAISGDRAIESLKIQFDPQETDFARDRAKVNADVVLRQSAWSKSPSRLNLGLGARMETPENMPSRAVVGGELNIQTDVLALVNHLLPRIKKRMGVEGEGRVVVTAQKPAIVQNEPRRPLIGRLLRGPRDAREPVANVPTPAPAPVPASTTAPAFVPGQAPAPENPLDGSVTVAVPPASVPAIEDHTFKGQLRDKLARTGTLQSMDELVDLVTYLAGLNICIQNEKIEGLMAAAQSAPTDVARRQAMQELAEARQQRDAMLFTRLTISRDSEGYARGFEINMVDSAIATGTRIENLHVVVSEQEVKVSGATRLFQGLELYPFVKPLVMNFLRGVQDRDAVTFDLQRGPFSGLWRQGRDAVVGPEVVPAPAP